MGHREGRLNWIVLDLVQLKLYIILCRMICIGVSVVYCVGDLVLVVFLRRPQQLLIFRFLQLCGDDCLGFVVALVHGWIPGAPKWMK